MVHHERQVIADTESVDKIAFDLISSDKIQEEISERQREFSSFFEEVQRRRNIFRVFLASNATEFKIETAEQMDMLVEALISNSYPINGN